MVKEDPVRLELSITPSYGKKPIIVGSECIGTCKGVSGIKNKIVYSKIKTSTASPDIVDQLNSLNDLYKSGVLTKEEFDKAKKKILN